MCNLFNSIKTGSQFQEASDETKAYNLSLKVQGIGGIRYAISFFVLCGESCGNSTSVLSIRLKTRPDADVRLRSLQ